MRRYGPYMLVHFAVKLTGIPAAVAYKKSYTAVGRETHVDVGFHALEIAAYKSAVSGRESGNSPGREWR